MINKETLDKITELERFHFDEGNRLFALRDRFYQEVCVGDPKLTTMELEYVTIEEHMERLEKLSIPFFNGGCVIKRVPIEEKSKRYDCGHCVDVYYFEWDFQSIEMFPDGVQWAKDNGLNVPEPSSS